jgi:hypothetical protein
MPARSRTFATTCYAFSGRALAALACLVVLTGWRFGPPVTFFEEPQQIARAIEKLRDSAGLSRIYSIEVMPTAIAVEAQDPSHIKRVKQWRLERHHVTIPLWEKTFNWEEISGPESAMHDPEAHDGVLFDLSDVDFSAAGELLREAVRRAALEQPAPSLSMSIRRKLLTISSAERGDLEWVVDVGSAGEHVRVYANGKGEIAHLDLTNANRGRAFDVLSAPDRIPEAARAVAAQLGEQPVLTKVRVTSTSVEFETNVVDKAAGWGDIKQRQAFTWTLGGLRKSLGSFETSAFFGADPAFAIAEADWSLLGAMAEDARKALGIMNETLTKMELTKRGDVGLPRLEWQVVFKDAKDEEAVARFDVHGALLHTLLPKSRRAPFDGLDAAAWPRALAEITMAFGGPGALAEVTLHSGHLKILATDPANPKELAEFFLDEHGLKKFGMGPMFETSSARFSASDLAVLNEAQLNKLKAATAARLGLEARHVTSVTISKASLDPSPSGAITVEIFAEEAPFKRSGRVAWEIDGREIKAYLP